MEGELRVEERWKDRQVWSGEVGNGEIREFEQVNGGIETEEKCRRVEMWGSEGGNNAAVVAELESC